MINPFSVRPASFNNFATASFPWMIASKICSGVTNSSEKVFNTAPERNRTLFPSRPIAWAGSPVLVGNFFMSSLSLLSTRLMVTLFFFKRYSIGESSISSKAFNICSVSIFGFLLLKASCCACCTTSAAFIVKLFKFILYLILLD